MAWYDVDFERLARQLTPPVLHRIQLLEWLDALLSPVKDLHAEFIAYRAEVIKRLRYNGQVIILENLLNDLFDNTNRGIYIDTVEDRLSGVYVYQPDEEDPEFIHQPGEADPLYIFQPGETLDSGYDFIVIVPDGILTSEEESRIKAVVNKYKLAGKKAAFQYYDGTFF